MPGRAERVVNEIRRPAEVVECIFDNNIMVLTEVDVAGRLTIDYTTNERIDIVDMRRDDDVYIYALTDRPVSDFIYDFEFSVLNTSDANGTMYVGLADSIGSAEDVANGLYVNIFQLGAGTNAAFFEHATSGTMATAAAITGLADDTTFYARFMRRGVYCYLGIFSDKIRETHVSESPCEYYDAAPAPYRYLYPVASRHAASGADAIDAQLKSFRFISSPDIQKYLGRHIA